jgi:hypothetical protein
MPEERESDYVVQDIHPGPYGDGKNFFILLTETGRPWGFQCSRLVLEKFVKLANEALERPPGKFEAFDPN